MYEANDSWKPITYIYLRELLEAYEEQKNVSHSPFCGWLKGVCVKCGNCANIWMARESTILNGNIFAFVSISLIQSFCINLI